LAKPPK
jgi:hypothetical protein